MTHHARFRRALRAVLPFAGAATAACTDQPPPTGTPPARPAGYVDVSPPAGVETSVYSETNVIADTPRMAGRFLRNVLVLLFTPGTSRAAREEAVDAVGGEVAGGIPLSADDGAYLVRVPDDGTDGPLFAAIDTLSRLPQVMYAGPEMLAEADSALAYLTPRDTTT